MKILIQLFTIAAVLYFSSLDARSQDIVVTGHVVSKGEHLPFVNILLEGTHYGTTTDITGHYLLVNLPAGEFTLTARMVGYKTSHKKIILKPGQTLEVKFELEEEMISVDEVVITGTKTFKRKTESPVIVNVLDAKAIRTIAANTVSESLSFQPGLRMETDCQTCNYTQLRMNGLGGAYSQILINSRPVFSPLTGLYGLEQIPAAMVERIEIVRGGGSALYGSSAIGGTVNIITRIPQRNSFEVTSGYSAINGSATDRLINGSVTTLSQKLNSGLSLFASHRQRDAYDHNADGFSEIPTLSNNSFGLNSFFKIDENQKLEANLSSLYEFRRGGDSLEEPAYLALQSEERTHNVLMGGVDYQYTGNNNRNTLILYLAGQTTRRQHFTGIMPGDSIARQAYLENPPYGNSKNNTLMAGLQWNHLSPGFPGGGNLFTVGAEFHYDDVYDQIKTYHYLIDQQTRNVGLFAQSDWLIAPELTVLTGVRADRHNLVDNPVVNPRISVLYRPVQTTQLRLSWSTGFRAPQAFDADMHIAFAGGGIQKIELAPDLHEERSQSWSLSSNFDKATEHFIWGYTLEGFHTLLKDAFILEETGSNADGNSILVKSNGGTSRILGTTLEIRANYNQKMQIETGITLQKSKYGQAVSWSSELPGNREYLRTPQSYGYFTFSVTPPGAFSASLSGVYTGSMKIPHYGLPGDPGTPERDELFISPVSWEINPKIACRIDIPRMDVSFEFSGGVYNLLGHYQNNFDSGKNRDSGFIYGPARPRSVFFGIKIFN